MTTKYIVNNLSGQTISGNLTIGGNLIVTGTTTNSGLGIYRALLTQTNPIVGTNLDFFNRGLIIGEVYTITNYVAGDDFSNVAQVQTGIINETGCVFSATGDTPISWTNGSELTSSGIFVIDVLENTLGFDLNWDMNPLGGEGTYYCYNLSVGPKYNTFPRKFTSVMTQLTSVSGLPLIQYLAQPYSLTAKDDIILLRVSDFDLGQQVNGYLYYTPLEIKINQNADITPIVISGTVSPSFPFNNSSIDLFCDGIFVENFYGGNNSGADINSLVTALNTDPVTSYLGTYSTDGIDTVFLTIRTNLASQFCDNGTLTFEVFSD